MAEPIAAEPCVVIVPGLGDSGPQHWQTLWQAAYPRHVRVVQRDWDRPRLDDWLAALDDAVRAAAAPVVIAAHSLACVLVAHWAARARATGDARAGGLAAVRCALLVAPADVDSPAHTPPETRGFAPIP